VKQFLSGVYQYEGLKWEAGIGWTGKGPMTFKWQNGFIEENVKEFRFMLHFTVGKPDLDGIVATASEGEVVLDSGFNKYDGWCWIDVTVKPQPNTVTLTVPALEGGLLGEDGVIDAGKMLDQCSPIPAPSAVVIVVAGCIASRRRRRTA